VDLRSAEPKVTSGGHSHGNANTSTANKSLPVINKSGSTNFSRSDGFDNGRSGGGNNRNNQKGDRTGANHRSNPEMN